MGRHNVDFVGRTVIQLGGLSETVFVVYYISWSFSDQTICTLSCDISICGSFAAIVATAIGLLNVAPLSTLLVKYW